jgi:hypothetical protein
MAKQYNEVETAGVWKPTVVGDRFEGILKSRKVLPGTNGKDYTQFTFGQLETGEEFKLSGAVLENKLAHIEDGSQVLLTYKGKPKNTYLDFSVMVWGDEPSV